MYQRDGGAAYKPDLKSTLELDAYFGHPHLHFRSIHVAGTNGKGSVAHMLAAVLQAAGYRTGLYTSPHLKDFRERIRINGKMIPEEAVTAFVSDHGRIIQEVEPSFFEMTVAMAFEHFSGQKVDVAVVEVGMGGRLDSTNIIRPLLSVITNIGLDHTRFLGDTLYKIAREKAGIMKPGVPTVVGETREETRIVFERRAKELGSGLYFADREYRVEDVLPSPEGKQLLQVSRNGQPWLDSLELDLLGWYQHRNLPPVLKSVELLAGLGVPMAENAVRSGLSGVRGLTGLRGRWEVLGRNPLVICDTVHNTEGMEQVVRQIRSMPWDNLHIILGTVSDKDPGRLLAVMPGEARYYFTQAAIPRAMDREKLAREAMKYRLHGRVCPTPARALEIARSEASAGDLVFIAGSTFLVAELL